MLTRFITLVSLVLALAGCGGGSEENNVTTRVPSTGGLPRQQVQQ